MKLNILLAALLVVGYVSAFDNGVARTPPMGWNSWNLFACNINEQLIIETIDAMSSKLLKYGYQYVNIDDCWSRKEGRDNTTKELIADPIRFPRGIKYLADYAHSKGVKLGIYSDVGFLTCAGYPASGKDFYEIDAKTFAKWGVDYLKFDWCFTDDEIRAAPWKFYGRMSQALNSTGRPIFYSICNWGDFKPWEWAPKISNSWRTTGDINPSWASVIDILDKNRPLHQFSGPYTFNDPDMLEVEVDRPPNKLTVEEARSHFTLWAMLNSPLLLGNDIRRIDDQDRKWAKDIITNEEVIALSQDNLVLQAKVLYEDKRGEIKDNKCVDQNGCVWIEVWGKQLVGGNIAVAVLNRAGVDVNDPKFKKESHTIPLKSIGLSDTNEYVVRNLWTKQKTNAKQQFTTDSIDQHSIAVYKFTKAQ
ncbi:alpha-galactosidase [Acrasis kona]|uniref:Alpha-galactosidase n=1 Tax=Acrasis kona TaxID=1008807 RepID=A0AAW2ZHF1_9EUKA